MPSPYNYSQTYGGIPNLPAYTTDTTKQTGTDVQGQMIQNLPNYLAMVGSDVGNISSNLAGQVSQQTTNLLSQQAAEWGAGHGQSLSPAAATGFLAKYGLTSAQMQALGHQQLTEAMQRTPIQQSQTASQTTDQGVPRSVYAAAPVPSMAAQASLQAAQQGVNAGRGGGGGVQPTAAPTSGMGYGYGQGPVMQGAYGATGVANEGVIPQGWGVQDYSDWLGLSQSASDPNYYSGANNSDFMGDSGVFMGTSQDYAAQQLTNDFQSEYDQMFQ